MSHFTNKDLPLYEKCFFCLAVCEQKHNCEVVMDSHEVNNKSSTGKKLGSFQQWGTFPKWIWNRTKPDMQHEGIIFCCKAMSIFQNPVSVGSDQTQFSTSELSTKIQDMLWIIYMVTCYNQAKSYLLYDSNNTNQWNWYVGVKWWS